MKCPSCNIKISLLKKPKLRIKSVFKKVMICPYCNITIHKKANKTGGYYEQSVFVFFLTGISLFLLAIIFGRHFGFKTALITVSYLWAIVGVIFLIILPLNLLYFMNRFLIWVNKKRKD